MDESEYKMRFKMKNENMRKIFEENLKYRRNRRLKEFQHENGLKKSIDKFKTCIEPIKPKENLSIDWKLVDFRPNMDTEYRSKFKNVENLEPSDYFRLKSIPRKRRLRELEHHPMFWETDKKPFSAVSKLDFGEGDAEKVKEDSQKVKDSTGFTRPGRSRAYILNFKDKMQTTPAKPEVDNKLDEQGEVQQRPEGEPHSPGFRDEPEEKTTGGPTEPSIKCSFCCRHGSVSPTKSYRGKPEEEDTPDQLLPDSVLKKSRDDPPAPFPTRNQSRDRSPVGRDPKTSFRSYHGQNGSVISPPKASNFNHHGDPRSQSTPPKGMTLDDKISGRRSRPRLRACTAKGRPRTPPASSRGRARSRSKSPFAMYGAGDRTMLTAGKRTFNVKSGCRNQIQDTAIRSARRRGIRIDSEYYPNAKQSYKNECTYLSSSPCCSSHEYFLDNC